MKSSKFKKFTIFLKSKNQDTHSFFGPSDFRQFYFSSFLIIFQFFYSAFKKRTDISRSLNFLKKIKLFSKALKMKQL